MYKDDKSLQKDLLFNAKSSDVASWFWHTKLTTSSWDDVEKTRFTGGDGKSAFSTRLGGKQLFVIAKKENGVECGLKEGWLQVLESGERCADFPIKETSGIYYSTKKTATLWSKGTNRPLKRQKNWAWTSGKCCTDHIILPVYRDNTLLRVEKWAKDQVGQGCVNTTPLKIKIIKQDTSRLLGKNCEVRTPFLAGPYPMFLLCNWALCFKMAMKMIW